MSIHKPYRRPYHWLIAFLLICQSMVAETPLVKNTQYGLSISSNTTLISDDEPTTIALHIQMPPKSHTYWKNPGDSGLPINVSWTLTDDNGNDVTIDDMITIGDIQWPTPVVFEYADIVGYGYEEHVTLLVDVTRKVSWPTETNMMLHAAVSWLECDVLCIPQQKDVTIELKAVNGPINHKTDLSQYLKWMPTLIDSYAVADNDQYEIHIPHDQMSQPIRHIDYYPYVSTGLDVASLSWVYDNDNEVVIRIGNDTAELSSVSGVIVINHDRRQAYSLEPIMSSPYKPSATFEQNDIGSLFNAIFIGFVGGIILNAMPCVFPILSLKILSIVSSTSLSLSQVRMQGLAYTAGIVVSINMLVLILHLLAYLGIQLGWGFQLQSPMVVLILIYVMLFVSLHLMGTLRLPGFIYWIQKKALRSHAKELSSTHIASSFWTGVLATAVSTPCLAPFFTPALTYALSETVFVSMLVFTSLGLGLAVPSLILTFFQHCRNAYRVQGRG